MLVKKQSLDVCKERCDRFTGVPWASPSLWFSQFLDSSWCGVPPFPVKKLQHKTFPISFYGVTLVVQEYDSGCNIYIKEKKFLGSLPII
jgi:hypothetical protein